MSITERDRRDIYNGLEDSLGSDVANNLMQLLPHEPAGQLVTRTDMQANTIMLQAEMAELRAEMRSEMAELRAEMRSEMAELRADLKGDMDRLHGTMQRMFAGALVVNGIAVITALLT